MRSEDRHRDDGDTRLEREATDARLGLIGELAGPGAAALAVHDDQLAVAQRLVRTKDRTPPFRLTGGTKVRLPCGKMQGG